MATIMIYEPNEIIAQKLCDSLKKEKYNAIRCDEKRDSFLFGRQHPPGDDGCAAALDHLRPLLEAFQKLGCPILF